MLTSIQIKYFWITTLILTAVAYLLAMTSRPLHDYIFYIEDWENILFDKPRRLDDWNVPISYGPLYYLLALLYYVHPTLPHLIFVCCWSISSFYLFHLSSRKKPAHFFTFIIWILVFLNPLLWFFIVYYGSLDSLLAFFTVFGLLYYKKHKYIASALFIALGISLKFMPIFIAPFLIFESGKINPKFTITLACLTILFFGIALPFTGKELLTNLIFQSDRPSVLLSIFYFLKADFSPLHLFTTTPNLDFLSVYVVLITQVIFFYYHVKLKLDSIFSSVFSLLLLLTFYKVGNHQYYISLLYVLLFYLHEQTLQKSVPFSFNNIIYCLLPVIFISSTPLIEFFIRNFIPSIQYMYNNSVGLFAFICSIIGLVSLFITKRNIEHVY